MNKWKQKFETEIQLEIKSIVWMSVSQNISSIVGYLPTVLEHTSIYVAATFNVHEIKITHKDRYIEMQ